jgi:hypothetical protein
MGFKRAPALHVLKKQLGKLALGARFFQFLELPKLSMHSARNMAKLIQSSDSGQSSGLGVPRSPLKESGRTAFCKSPTPFRGVNLRVVLQGLNVWTQNRIAR